MRQSRKSTQEKQPDYSFSKSTLIKILAGSWLLFHDLADRAIHSVSSDNESLPGQFLKLAHNAENELKEKIRLYLKELGLATKDDVSEIVKNIETIEKKLRR